MMNHESTPQTHRISISEVEATRRFAEAPEALIDIGHSKLAYYRFGAGPDLVCVHGWPLHAATFRRLVPHLAPHFTLHLVDLPGTGQSVWDRGSRIGLRAHAESVRRAVDHLGLRRFAYLGHDSGAAIARAAAADDPRVFASVMGNTEVPGHVPWQVAAFVLASKIPGGFRAVLSGMRLGVVRRGPLGFGGCFTDPAYVDGPFGELFVRPLLDDARVAAGQARLLGGLDHDLVDGLADIHARLSGPSLLVWGPDDPFFPIARARAMLPQFTAGAELVEIPHGKLFTHEDHAQAFATHTRDFLLRHA